MMMQNTWQLVTVILMAIAMSASFAHLMELPPKKTFEPQLYVQLHRTLYPNFGRIAGTAEILALVSIAALTWAARGSPAFAGTLVSALCLAVAHGVFWILVHPANVTMIGWSLDAIPADWTRWRDRWEYSHAARAILMVVALGAFVRSITR